jgi:hypothetical protein
MTMDTRAEELRLLRDIARWTREAALPLVKGKVERLLDTDPKKRAYAAMEHGTSSKAAIGTEAGVNPSRDLNPWLVEWEAEGIVDRDSNPPKATFSLSELGIVAPAAKVDRTRKAGK